MGVQQELSKAREPNRSTIKLQRSQQNAPRSNDNSNSITPQSASSGKQSRRSKSASFPAQKNTLLSWVRPGLDTTAKHPPATRCLPPSFPSLLPLPQPLYGREQAEALPTTPPLAADPIPGEVPTPARPRVLHDGLDPTNTDSPLPERTALQLAKQLRKFQGCTHEEHAEAERKHQAHHQRPDVHSECFSIPGITSMLRGSHAGGRPLPDVFSNSKLMRATDIPGADCQAAFEGTSVKAALGDAEAREQELPRNLCLNQHHIASRKNRRPRVAFDIDSTCCFPTSLGFARRGVDWFPRVHPFLNLTADINFGLKVRGYTANGRPSERYAPLHKVPHYCFGSVIGMSELLVFVFFPALYEESDYEHSTYLSKHDQQLWTDAIVLPSVTKVVGSSNILLHYPASSRVASLDATAVSSEGLARKESAREQLLKHAIQPKYLDLLWTAIQETIEENPGFHRFQGATLFTHDKNTKLEFSRPGLTDAYNMWEWRWSEATDPDLYNKDRTYVDLAKQTTSEDSALSYDQIPDDHEAETFLWRKCCLYAYSRTRTTLNPDGSKAKGNLKPTVYPWATMRDTVGQTFFAAPQGVECRDGLIYSQFYALIKTPFDSTKVYVFDNDSVENLALDPGYERSLQ